VTVSLILVELLRDHSNQVHHLARLQKLLDLPRRSTVDEQLCVPGPRPQRFVSESEESAIVDRYQAGETVKVLAHAFGLHKDRVSAILERHGVARRYHETTAVDLDSAALLEADGLTLTEIARRLGVGRTTLVRARRAARASASA